jgi:cell division transport system permease protein
MRLVGASNFYIQLPFLLEAALAAALGAVLAIGSLILMKTVLIDQVLAPSFQFTAFVGWDAVATIAPIMLLTGVGLACIAAFFTLRKYLRV